MGITYLEQQASVGEGATLVGAGGSEQSRGAGENDQRERDKK